MEQKVGLQLKALRESRNISLKTLSQKTKIGVSLLQHLEADEYDRLPNKIYVRGFIKSYAAVLNIDERPLVTAFDAQFVIPGPIIENLKYAPKPGEAKKNPVPTIITTAMVAGLVGFAGIFFIYKSSQKKIVALKKPVPVKIVPVAAPKVETIPEEKITPPPAPVVKVEKVEPTTNALVNQEELFTYRSNEKQLIETYLPKNIQNSMVEGKQNVFVNAFGDDTWLTYKIDGNPIKKYVLEKGKTLFLKGDEIKLFIGNVHSTVIFLNNRPLEIVSKSGVKSLIFPEQNKTKYKIPFFIFNEDGTVKESDPIN